MPDIIIQICSSKPFVLAVTIFGSLTLIIAGGWLIDMVKRRRTTNHLRSVEWSCPHKTMHADELIMLPEPVRKYLTFAIKEGRKQIRFATVRHSGSWRSLSQQNWGTIRATSYYTGTIPGLVWFATIRKSWFMWTKAHLLYDNGVGSGSVKFAGIITLFDPEGKEVSYALLARILMETVWFPTSLMPGGLLRWEPINASSARAILVNEKKTITAEFHFNENNHVERIITRDKYRDAETSYEREQCTMYCTNYKEYDGIHIPTEITIEWNMEEGDFEYAKLRVDSVRYE